MTKACGHTVEPKKLKESSNTKMQDKDHFQTSLASEWQSKRGFHIPI